MYLEIFLTLSFICFLVRSAQYYTETRDHSTTSSKPRAKEFRLFQLNYITVYLLAVASDWLQGPYVYALYSEYGYSKAAIGQLFIAGFGSSAVFGTFVGSIADKYGRKCNVMVFVVTYALSCATKHSPDYWILMIGRILGGVATSILFSAFESWLVYEHNKRGFEQGWLAETFSKAQFGNGVVAIVCGQVAGVVAGKFGKVAPFDMSAIVLGVTGLIVMLTWSENYGDSRQSIGGGMKNAWNIMVADERILLVGIIQSVFEGAMYTFVFIWTPALQVAQKLTEEREIPHGMIFSTFMVAIMIGSSLFSFLIRQQPSELFMRNLFILGFVCFAVATVARNVWEMYGAFLIFEVVCGVYFPAMSTMRAKYVPEETRSAMMNFFRVPLNVIVVFTLYKNFETKTVFQLCAGLLALAVICQQRLFSVSKASIGTNDDWTREEQQEMLEDGEPTVEQAVK
eukprot:Plantae.Rhodophyta-Hildenbrandia_rubra.ctg4607.p1 GENE.Plantae.Rhodophyta-Hildenbrandia_rubra.ctg4607~~Plantae.Rhodophyta-Hildenbrandia_rubra.ctg4607.p1  ORF type:complete len:455 (+),score=54.96 Plantae.Rhodophyta-Hildenbrandia_rubra.ctg4607:277-1641(+)